MTRLLTWLNRQPCRCTRYAERGWQHGSVDVFCWRHALLWWLCEHNILRSEEGDYFHNGWVEWRPWRWTENDVVAEYYRNHPDKQAA